MKPAELQRLLDLLLMLSEQEWVDGATRDEISHVRYVIGERLDGE